jgi:hypothetical protein
VSIRALRFSAHPSFWASSRNMARHACPSWSFSPPPINTPMRRVHSAWCASVVSDSCAACISYSAGSISQDLSVQNNSYLPIKIVTIRCRFSQDLMRKQIGAGTVKIENIASNAIGYKTMTVASHTKPISATCHIVSATRPSVQY